MTSNRYLLHSELPQPIRFREIQIDAKQELAVDLQNFIDTYSNEAKKFTIDDDNVGRGLVCAFMEDSIKGIMVYSKKEQIQEYLTQQGFQCSLSKSNPNEVSPIIQCIRI